MYSVRPFLIFFSLSSFFFMFFFFLMIRRPPRSTLFPYTRSSDLVDHEFDDLLPVGPGKIDGAADPRVVGGVFGERDQIGRAHV